MRITAHLENAEGRHEVVLATEGARHTLNIPPKETGMGSKANGGEILFLALATCYCNDIYREAARRGIEVQRVEVDVTGEFGKAGEPARNVTYSARVTAKATEQEIHELMIHTDRVAEIHNSLRAGTQVTLAHRDAKSTARA
jgi:organic hydroperoxide reductase OsmC/OhrA